MPVMIACDNNDQIQKIPVALFNLVTTYESSSGMGYNRLNCGSLTTTLLYYTKSKIVLLRYEYRTWYLTDGACHKRLHSQPYCIFGLNSLMRPQKAIKFEQ